MKTTGDEVPEFVEIAEVIAEQAAPAVETGEIFGSLGAPLQAREIPIEGHAAILHIVEEINATRSSTCRTTSRQ